MAKKISSEQVAGKLASAGFAPRPAAESALQNPSVSPIQLGATPMTLTIDQVQPSHVDPRLKKNPQYDEIKESIRARGLDHMPVVTRRAGEDFYRIRDGGNTRLSILKELWTETKDERYYRMNVLFKPYESDIRAMAGHMAENDMRGGLSLIERALGLENLRKLYLQADNVEEISQRELARRLKSDGYPVSNSTISRMQDVVRFLLPAIPDLLYAGLGIDSAVRLIALRKSASAVWDKHVAPNSIEVFEETFIQALGGFGEFNFQRMQDELIGQMSEALEADYAILSLDIQEESDKSRKPAADTQTASSPTTADGDSQSSGVTSSRQEMDESAAQKPAPEPKDTKPEKASPKTAVKSEQSGTSVKPRDVSEPGLSIWPIATNADQVGLRSEIRGLVQAIATEIGISSLIAESDDGLGFSISEAVTNQRAGTLAAATLAVFKELNQLYHRAMPSSQSNEEQADSDLFSAPMGLLLMGKPTAVFEGQTSSSGRLSDSAVISLFRVIRLVRHLIDLECQE